MTETVEPRVHRPSLVAPRPISVFVALLAAVAIAAAAWIAQLDGPGDRDIGTIGWLLLAVAFAASEVLVVHVHVRGDSYSLSFSEIPLVIGLLFVAPPVLLAADLAGVGTALLVHRRQGSTKLFFNLAKVVLELSVALLVLHVAGVPGVVPDNSAVFVTFAATGVTAFVGAVLVSLAIGIASRDWSDLGFWSGLPISLFGTVTATALGLMAVTLLDAKPTTAWLLLVPVMGCLGAYAFWNHQDRRLQSLGFLERTAQVLQDYRSLDDAIVALLAETRDLLKSRAVELLYRQASGAGVHARFDDDLGGRVETCPTATVDDAIATLAGAEAAVLVAAASERVLVERFGPGDGTCILAPLTVDGAAIGVLLVSPPLSEVARFGEHERRLVDTTARALSVSIENGALERSLAQFRVRERALSRQVLRDPMTGLANRAGLLERVAQLEAGPDDRPVAAMFIDLDDFKQVNDTLGHRAGDELLVEVARRLRACVRSADLPARLGGDEFAVLLAPLDDEHTAVLLADRVLAALSSPVDLGDRTVPLSASIGVATGPPRALDRLLDRADGAMYVAKSSGKRAVAHAGAPGTAPSDPDVRKWSDRIIQEGSGRDDRSDTSPQEGMSATR